MNDSPRSVGGDLGAMRKPVKLHEHVDLALAAVEPTIGELMRPPGGWPKMPSVWPSSRQQPLERPTTLSGSVRKSCS